MTAVNKGVAAYQSGLINPENVLSAHLDRLRENGIPLRRSGESRNPLVPWVPACAGKMVRV